MGRGRTRTDFGPAIETLRAPVLDAISFDTPFARCRYFRGSRAFSSFSVTMHSASDLTSVERKRSGVNEQVHPVLIESGLLLAVSEGVGFDGPFLPPRRAEFFSVESDDVLGRSLGDAHPYVRNMVSFRRFRLERSGQIARIDVAAILERHGDPAFRGTKVHDMEPHVKPVLLEPLADGVFGGVRILVLAPAEVAQLLAME